MPIDPSLDERTGPNALPIAKRVADVVGQTPSALERLSMPAWPATRPADGDPASPHRVVTATAEVTRVRRVARFLAFATLRPLAPLRIAPKCEDGDAGEEEEEEEEEEIPLAPGTTLQLIAGRTLLERMGGEAGMENTLRGLRPGAVLAVTGRLQANPRPAHGGCGVQWNIVRGRDRGGDAAGTRRARWIWIGRRRFIFPNRDRFDASRVRWCDAHRVVQAQTPGQKT